MRILFRKPSNQPLQLMEVENELKPIQDLIGGYLQVVDIGQKVICILDEEGMLKGCSPNYYHDMYGMILGNVIFCGVDGGEFTSLTDKQIEYVADYIGFPIERVESMHKVIVKDKATNEVKREFEFKTLEEANEYNEWLVTIINELHTTEVV